jgi:hypothetical protein
VTVAVALPDQRRDAWVELLKPAAELARVISNTEFVPKDMRGRDAAITAAILTAHELNVQPMTALSNIAIIDGKPALSATLMRALVLSRGHEIWFEENTSTKVTAAGRRRDSDNVTRVTWTLEMARNANLAAKQNWRQYPRAMLTARASAELCRDVFPDCLAGLTHAIEELEDQARIQTITGEEPPPTDGNRRRRPAIAAPLANSTPPAEQPPLPGEEQSNETQRSTASGAGETPAPPPPPQSEALKKMFSLFREIGIEDRADRLAVASRMIGRQVASSKELAEAEVDVLLNVLSDIKDRKVELFKATDGSWNLVAKEPSA